jgi:hypothetical protein
MTSSEKEITQGDVKQCNWVVKRGLLEKAFVRR